MRLSEGFKNAGMPQGISPVSDFPTHTNTHNMARRKIIDRNVRSLTKVSGGSSYAVTLPKEFIHTLRWQARQKLKVTLEDKKIIIEDWNR